jgi:hypothetical protein
LLLPLAQHADGARNPAAARSLIAEEKLPGLSLAVAVNGEIVWAESFGWANLLGNPGYDE